MPASNDSAPDSNRRNTQCVVGGMAKVSGSIESMKYNRYDNHSDPECNSADWTICEQDGSLITSGSMPG